MKSYVDLVNDALPLIQEVFPWDTDEMLQGGDGPLLLDIREESEYEAMHIAGSINVPRGVLEAACDYGYEETVKELVEAREREVVVICRSGNRSALAALTMQLMGYKKVSSMKTGLAGWNDYELPLVSTDGEAVTIDSADSYFTTRVRPDQLAPGRQKKP